MLESILILLQEKKLGSGVICGDEMEADGWIVKYINVVKFRLNLR